MPAAEISVRSERILDAAAALIAHYGYDKTTVSDIAREAGVSKGAVYLHWSSKDDLFKALLRRETQRMMADIQVGVDADPDGGSIAGVFRSTVLALTASPFMRALYTRDAHLLGDLARQRDPDRYAQRFLFGQDYTRQMQSAGLLRSDLSPQVITYVLSIISYGLLTVGAVIPPEHAPPIEETLSVLGELVHRGLAAPSTGSSAAGQEAFRRYIDGVRGQFDASTALRPQSTS